MALYARRIIKFLFIFFISLYCLIWLLSPVILRAAINHYGLPKSMHLTAESTIRYNPFLAHLSISDLVLKGAADKTEVELSSLEFELHLYQLFFDKIYIPEFQINTVSTSLTIQDSKVVIAGFNLLDNKNIKQGEGVKAEPNTNNVAFPYQVIVPTLQLTNLTTAIDYQGHQYVFVIEKLAIDNSLYSEQKQSLALDLSARLNDAPISVKLTTTLNDKQGSTDIEVSLKDLPLESVRPFTQEIITDLEGKIGVSAKIVADLKDDGVLLSINDLLISSDNVKFDYNDLSLTLEKQSLSADEIDISIMDKQNISIEAKSKFQSYGIVITDKISQGELLKIASFAVGKVNSSLLNDIPMIDIAGLKVTDVILSKPHSADLPQLASFSSLDISHIAFDSKKLAVKTVLLSQLNTDIVLNKNKQLANLILISNGKGIDDDNEEKGLSEIPLHTSSTAEEQNPLAFSLETFRIVEGASILFLDNSVEPSYTRTFQVEELDFLAIDSDKPEQKSQLSIKGSSNKYAHFNLTGSGQPLLNQPNYHLAAKVNEVSLPGISPYIKDALNYEIESGQLDVNLAVNLIGNEIDGDVDLMLRSVEFTAADDHEANTLADHTSIPFNIALGMLKDSDGNVELSIPLTGDTSSPSFGFSGFIALVVKQATVSAAKEYLINTFIPYASVMKVALAAGEYALKVSVSDLNYSAKQIELDDKQKEFARQMSVMLDDKKEINVKLCAIATLKDADKQLALPLTNKTDIDYLNSISQQRVDNFKAYMVNELNVDSSRLLLCTPQIDTASDSIAHISFEI